MIIGKADSSRTILEIAVSVVIALFLTAIAIALYNPVPQTMHYTECSMYDKAVI